MRSTYILAVAGATFGAFAFVGCNGVALPGRTAGATWGGSYSHHAATKEEPKPEKPPEVKKAKYPKGPPGPHDRPGYVTRVKGDAVWVFTDRTKELADFDQGIEPANAASLDGAGPNGLALKGPSSDTLDGWRWSRPGYEVFVRKGKVWAVKADSLDALWLRTGGEPGKHALLVGEGPEGKSIRSTDIPTAEAYAALAKTSAAGAREALGTAGASGVRGPCARD